MSPFAERLLEENRLLAPVAVPHQGVLGRLYPEAEDTERSPFQRDRDRILHSFSFRRLQGKTQVFVTGGDDHFRTRLTHTMEVAQISRDLARSLRLNEDLAECIALAHDLGHPPFGHAGEETLDTWMREHGGHFEHNEQSLRIVTVLETHSSQYLGLNLNREVTDGMQKHSAIPRSVQSHLVDCADAIAYSAHDCDDGLTAGMFSFEELLHVPLAAEARVRTERRGTRIRGALIELLTSDLLAHSTLDARTLHPISFSQPMQSALADLQTFLRTHLYYHPAVTEQTKRGQETIRSLCTMLHASPPAGVHALRERTGSTLPEAVKDYIAGMTDPYAHAVRASLEQIA